MSLRFVRAFKQSYIRTKLHQKNAEFIYLPFRRLTLIAFLFLKTSQFPFVNFSLEAFKSSIYHLWQHLAKRYRGQEDCLRVSHSATDPDTVLKADL